MAERDEWKDEVTIFQSEIISFRHEIRGDVRIIQWLMIASFSVAGAVLTAAAHFLIQSRI